MSIKVNIHKKLKGFHLDVDVETRGKRIGILGASGCGKSMTLKAIAGIEKPDKGLIQVGDQILFESKKHINLPPQKRKVGYMFQNYALFPHMTVEENIGIGVYKDKAAKEKIVQEQIKRFHLEGLEKRRPGELSGGQQQRVALARIFAYEPDVILLDEPFSALDRFLKDQLVQELLELLKDFKGEIIIVSHNRDEIYTLCDELIIMDQGHPLLIGDTKEIFKNPQKVEAAKLTGCKNISPIEKISSYELLATNWNIRLQVAEEISDEIKYIGIRAHDIKEVNCEAERYLDKSFNNVLEVDVVQTLEYPFEMQYILKHNKGTEGIWYKTSKTEKIMSKKLKIQLPMAALMLLK